MPDIIFVGGLPGSGKSHILEEFRKGGWKIYDDFQAGAYENWSHFSNASAYAELMEDLKLGRKCAVADIRFVCSEYRAGAEHAIQDSAGLIAVDWRIYENNPEQCSKNVLRTPDSRSPAPRLEKIREFTTKHSVPEGVVSIPVWQEE